MNKLVFFYPVPFQGGNVLYLDGIIWKFDSMACVDNWDFRKPVTETLRYAELNCFGLNNDIMRCAVMGSLICTGEECPVAASMSR